MHSETDITQELPEIERLAESVCCGNITATEVDRLGDLLSSDLALCQKYLCYMNVHGSLDIYCKAMPVETLTTLSGPALLASHNGLKQSNLKLAVVFSVVTLSMLVLLAWLLPRWSHGAANVLASVSIVSADASFEGETGLEVGSIIGAQQAINLKKGTLKIKARSGVEMIVKAPLSLVYENANRITLNSGSMFVRVPPAAIGFTVNTPESELVDMGTAFYVQRDTQKHTLVYVDQGRVDVARIGEQQQKVRARELTAGEAVELPTDNLDIHRIVPKPEQLISIRQLAGHFAEIRRIDGTVRFSETCDQKTLESPQELKDRILIIPERIGYRLQTDLQLTGHNGASVSMPAGSRVSIYMLLYDPSESAIVSPIGAVSFHQPISAIVHAAADLEKIDREISAVQTHPGIKSPLRGLEPDEDEIDISADRKTVSFHLDYSPPVALDQVRIIIQHENTRND